MATDTPAGAPTMPDDVALEAAAEYGRHDYQPGAMAYVAAVGWRRGWADGYTAGREAERERIAARPVVKELDFKLLAKHQFSSSRPWPDGTKPTAPDWNPGCSCGASHYYFEHPRHLAEVVAEYLTRDHHDA